MCCHANGNGPMLSLFAFEKWKEWKDKEGKKNLGAGQVAKKLNLINKEGKFYSGQFS